MQDSTYEDVLALSSKEQNMAPRFHSPQPRSNVVAATPDFGDVDEAPAGVLDQVDVPDCLGSIPGSNGVLDDGVEVREGAVREAERGHRLARSRGEAAPAADFGERITLEDAARIALIDRLTELR